MTVNKKSKKRQISGIELIVLTFTLLWFACTTNNSSIPAQLAMPPDIHARGYTNQEPLLPYLESGSTTDKYDIAIVFEGITIQEITSRMNRVFGSGSSAPFSLFNTNVFKNNRNRFNIYYGATAKINDQNNQFASSTSQAQRATYFQIVRTGTTLLKDANNVGHYQSEFRKLQTSNSITADLFDVYDYAFPLGIMDDRRRQIFAR